MTRMQYGAARKAAAAFLLVNIAWAGVTAAAISKLSRLCAPLAACERPRNWLVGLAFAATLASAALARWGARHLQRPMPVGDPEPQVTLWQEGGQPVPSPAPEEPRAIQQREEERRTADVLGRMRGLQESVLKSRRARAG